MPHWRSSLPDAQCEPAWSAQHLCIDVRQSGLWTSTDPVLQLTSMQLCAGQGAGKETGAFSEPSQTMSFVEDEAMLMHTHLSPSWSNIGSHSESIGALPGWACPRPSSSCSWGHSRAGCTSQDSCQVPHLAEPEHPRTAVLPHPLLLGSAKDVIKALGPTRTIHLPLPQESDANLKTVCHFSHQVLK